MATKKKPAKKAVKKATKKTAKKVVKKTAARKAVKKVVKRAYNRKAPIKARKETKPRRKAKSKPTGLVTSPESSAAEALQEMIQNGSNADVTSQATGHLLDEFMETAHRQMEAMESFTEQLQQIGALDLRLSPTTERFAILVLLANYGYIATNLNHLVEDKDNLNILLRADTLRLNHVNKIVVPGIWEDIQDVKAISTVHALTWSEINFDKPRPAYPEDYFIGDAQYIRVR